jgi:hypothetical protein
MRTMMNAKRLTREELKLIVGGNNNPEMRDVPCPACGGNNNPPKGDNRMRDQVCGIIHDSAWKDCCYKNGFSIN